MGAAEPKRSLHGNPRYVKGQGRVGRYNKSSALSDTSEAPSIASHVRGVRVPSPGSDVDQFVDDLFSPVLDTGATGADDGLSDARSLAASMKGGGVKPPQDGGRDEEEDELEMDKVDSLVEAFKGGAGGGAGDEQEGGKTSSAGQQGFQVRRRVNIPITSSSLASLTFIICSQSQE